MSIISRISASYKAYRDLCEEETKSPRVDIVKAMGRPTSSPREEREFLLDVINNYVDAEVEVNKQVPRNYAEFNALCMAIDRYGDTDVAHRITEIIVTDLLFNEYSEHQQEIMAYLGLKSLAPNTKSAVLHRMRLDFDKIKR